MSKNGGGNPPIIPLALLLGGVVFLIAAVYNKNPKNAAKAIFSAKSPLKTPNNVDNSLTPDQQFAATFPNTQTVPIDPSAVPAANTPFPGVATLFGNFGGSDPIQTPTGAPPKPPPPNPQTPPLTLFGNF